jgi:hypothetical protein
MQSEFLFKLVAATFAELGTGDAPIRRAYWHLEGYFVGYCFDCGDLRAIMKLDGEVIEFLGAGGQLLRVVSLLGGEKRDAA